MKLSNTPMVSMATFRSLQSLAQKLSPSDGVSAKATARGADAAILAAVEAERRQLARLLHDEVAQLLTIANIELALLSRSTAGTATGETVEEIKHHIASCSQAVRQLMTDLGAYNRDSHDINDKSLRWSPRGVETSRNPANVGSLHRELNLLVKRMQSDFGLKVDIQSRITARPNVETRELLLRSARELLVNVAKHAESSIARLSVFGDEHSVNITVEDDGVGFNQHSTASQGSNESGFGLQSIREDLTRIGGRMSIESTRGCGTRITLTVPGELSDDRPDTFSAIGRKYLAAINERLANKALPSGNAA